MIRRALAYLAAVLLTAILATVLATQFVLARLAALDAAPDLRARLATTWHDLLGMGPGYAALIAIGFLVALPVASWLSRRLPVDRNLLFALAGASAVGAILYGMKLAFGMTTIAGARGTGGLLAQLAAGAAGGVLFARFTGGRMT